MNEIVHDDKFPPPPYPFPERASSLLEKMVLPEPIPLNEDERKRVYSFEEGLFKKLRGVEEKLKKISDHTIYPEGFAESEGRRLFAALYQDGKIWRQIAGLLEGAEDEKIEKVHTAFFEDLKNACENEESFESYKRGEYNLEKTAEALGQTPESLKSLIRPRVEGKVNSQEDIRDIFLGADHQQIPDRIRALANRYSADIAHERFVEDFIREFSQGEGNIENVENPVRVSVVVNPEDLAEKIRAYRKFKNSLKWVGRELEANAELSQTEKEAKIIILGIYARYTNQQIADFYEYGRLIAQKPVKNETEMQVLRLLGPGLSHPDKLRRFNEEPAPRTMQRIDRFLEGVGLTTDADGNIRYSAFTAQVDESAREKLRQPIRFQEGKEEERRFNANEVAELGNRVLNCLGFETWEFMVSDTANTVRVKAKKEGEGKKGEGKKDKVLIPANYSNGKNGVVETIASELAHICRIEAKRSRREGGLKILSVYHTAGVEVLGEGTDKYFANQALKEMGVEEEEKALPYAYSSLRRLEKGGSFRDAFLANLEARAQRSGKTVKEFVEGKREEELLKLVNSVLRNFRRHTPLEEELRYLPYTGQLRYIEGEIVVEKLMKTDELWQLAFVSGIDIYTALDLIRLGELDLSNIREPDFSFVKNVIIPYFEEKTQP